MTFYQLLHPISPAFSFSKPCPKLTIKLSNRFCVSSNYDFLNQKSPCETKTDTNSRKDGILSSKTLISLAISVALIAPLPSSAIPSLNSKFLPLSSATTPFSQARNLPTGLENGKIRPCPSINPGCLSTNPKSSNFTFPWSILRNTPDSAAIEELKDAILKTQKNVKIQLVEDTPNVEENTGKYLQAEVDGGFGRDLLEFLVNKDVVSFRAMATKVTYVYPFTTAFGDSKGQELRLKQIIDELGWYAPSFESMD